MVCILGPIRMGINRWINVLMYYMQIPLVGEWYPTDLGGEWQRPVDTV